MDRYALGENNVKHLHLLFKILNSSEPRRLCGKDSSTRLSASCDSVTYNTFGINYSHVCGRVIGYQYRVPDAFLNSRSQTIEGYYVDGVSLTHGLLEQGNTSGPLLLE